MIRTRRIYASSFIKAGTIIALIFMLFVSSNVSNRNFRQNSSTFHSLDSIKDNLEQSYESDDVPADDVVFVPLQDIMRSPFTFDLDDKRVIKMIVNDFSKRPSMEPYELDSHLLNTSNWQQSEIMKLLNNKKNGVFVECGALDGQYLSNTLDLEMKHGWSGVLIEPDPLSYQKLLKKHRKSWTVEACLSIHSYMGQVILQQNDALSKVIFTSEKKIGKGFVRVQCFPLFSILLALNMTKIDYFSLDIEGQELKVLKTLPWDKVNITTFSIEFNHMKEGKLALKRYMRSKGYEMHLDGSRLRNTNDQNVDLLFYHKKLLQK